MNIQMIRNSIVRNSPKICAVIATAGVGLTAYLAAKATPGAMRMVELKKDILQKEKLTAKEKINAAWKCYLPTVASAVITTGAIITGHSIHLQRYGELAAAYGLGQTVIRLYSGYVSNKYGEESAQEMRRQTGIQMMQTAVVDTKVVPRLQTDIPEEGEGRDKINKCFDYLSGRYFYASQNEIRKTIDYFNDEILKQKGYACLNELYSCFNDPKELPEMGFAQLIGWKWVDGRGAIPLISIVADKDGNPCMMLDFANPPQYDYDKL